MHKHHNQRQIGPCSMNANWRNKSLTGAACASPYVLSSRCGGCSPLPWCGILCIPASQGTQGSGAARSAERSVAVGRGRRYEGRPAPVRFRQPRQEGNVPA